MKQLGFWTLAFVVMTKSGHLSEREVIPAPVWTYERLFRESDLVVIAEALSKTDTGESRKLVGKLKYLGVNTQFESKVILKGKLDANMLRVFHFREPKKKNIKNGPTLVVFRLKPLTFEMNSLGGRNIGIQGELPAPEYLLFLKRLKDGRYEPVTGQVFASDSVREIYHTLFNSHEFGEEE